MEVPPITAVDRPALRRVLEEEWGLPVVSISGAYDPSTLDGFVAEEEGRLAGVITYRVDGRGCEVVTLNAWPTGRGTGSALLAAAKRLADERGARLWLITTNDNLEALAFYQRRGMDITALHRGFGDQVRARKPSVQDLGIPLRHAFELSY